MKEKKSGVIVIGVLAALIGLVLAIQISTSNVTEVGGLIPMAKVQGLEQKLKQVSAEKEAVTQELLELQEKMDEIESNSIDEDALLKSMSEDLEKYKMSAGVVDVKGPGIIVTIEDPVAAGDGVDDGYSTIMVRYELLLSMVNKMKEAGAEAVSINGNRVVNTTEISLAGNNVNINGTPTAPPYTIKAIGNPDTLEATLNIRYGIVDTMEDYDLRVSIAKQQELEIPRYSGVIKFRYASPIEKE